MKYAIVEDGGKQYKAVEGETIEVDLFPADVDEQIDLERVLLITDGEITTVGAPVIPGARVQATVMGEIKGPKLVVFQIQTQETHSCQDGAPPALYPLAHRCNPDRSGIGGSYGT